MRQLLFVAALLGAASLVHAAENGTLKTNSIPANGSDTLEILTPPDWTLARTNLSTAKSSPPTYELHAPKDTVVIRLTIYWDGLNKRITNPSAAEMDKIVSNVVVSEYLPISTEKTLTLEKLAGPGVTGTFSRLTDARWTPVVKDEHSNLATGMFRCKNLWGHFFLLCDDKDGPQFKQGLEVLKSLRQP